MMPLQVPKTSGKGPGGSLRRQSQAPRGKSGSPEGIFCSPSSCIGSCGSNCWVGEDASCKFLLGLLKAGTCAAVQGVDLQEKANITAGSTVPSLHFPSSHPISITPHFYHHLS